MPTVGSVVLPSTVVILRRPTACGRRRESTDMSRSAAGLTRRRFIGGSASLAASSVVAPLLRANALQPAAAFRSRWDTCPDRLWLGPEYWANPLQDWRIANGRIECTNAAA